MQYVLINENNCLLDPQKRLLSPGYETIPVPEKGWNYDQQIFIAANLEYEFSRTDEDNTVIFACHVPFLLKELTLRSVGANFSVWVMQKDIFPLNERWLLA